MPLASTVLSAASVSPGAGLTGKPWRLEKLVNEQLSDGQEAPYLLFTNTGDLHGFGGCNYFTGRYRLGDDGRLVVSSLRASHQKCLETSERETTLLTSLLLANSLQLNDEGLNFFMNGSNLMKMEAAPAISVDELLQQGKLLKVKKSRGQKNRAKKKKGSGKGKKLDKKSAPKPPGKKPRDSGKPTPKP